MRRKNKRWILALGALAMSCSLGAAITLNTLPSTSAGISRAVAVYSSEEEKTSGTLSSFKVDGFGELKDFTNWFDVSYNMYDAGKSIADYVTYNETNQSVLISNTSKDYLDLRFHLDGAYNPALGYHGKTLLGNFEIKMTVKGVNVGAGEDVYFGSRVTWESSNSSGTNLSVALKGKSDGKHDLTRRTGTFVSDMGKATDFTGLNTSSATTITIGYVNNYAYFYYGDHLVNGYNVIKTMSASANSTAYRDGNQIFGMYLTGSSTAATEIELLNFSYERLDSEFDLGADENVTREVIATRLAPKRNAIATYSSETKSSATLSSFSTYGFGRVEDFTEWFSLGYQDNKNASRNINDYLTYNPANRSITIRNTAQTGLDFRFHPDGKIGSNGYYGKTELGNFEIKMTLQGLNISASENVYFTSRDTWDSTAGEYANMRVGLTGVNATQYSYSVAGDGISYVTGGVSKVQNSPPIAVTIGYVNNHVYFYYGNYASNGYSIAKSDAVEANANSARDGNQSFSLFLTGSDSYGTEVEIYSFSYKRLDSEFNINATDEETLAIIGEQVKTQRNAVANYSSETQSSATLTSFNVDTFGGKEDFTDWFVLGHANGALNINDYVKYDATQKSVKINNTATTALDFRFHPDGAIGSNEYYGKTELGNFEVKLTVKGIGVAASENVYFGSRMEWDSSLSTGCKLSTGLTGNANGTYTFGSSAGSYVEGARTEGLVSTSPLTITIGYVNNYSYFYYGNHLTNGYKLTKNTTKTNTDSVRDGNQIFAICLTGAAEYTTEIEILNFSYQRLDAEFNLSATDDVTKAIISDRLTVKGNTYAETLDFNFTDASKLATNQAFIDGLSAGTDTYSVGGTQYKHEITEEGLVMQNTTSNSHGLSYLALATHQYENSAVQLSLSVADNSVFELYVRTAANSTNFATDGYHLIIERTGGYTYLKLESRKGGFASLKTVTLPSGELCLMLKTEKVVDGTSSYTKFTVYTDGISPVISMTDQDVAAANKCGASLGNLAFAVRNQGTNKGKVIVKKMAIYTTPSNAYWPRKDYNGLRAVEKVDDMSYTFGSTDTDNAQAKAFMDKISVYRVSPDAQGVMELTDNGSVALKHTKTSRYARTQYEFGAYNLKNYTVMMEVEVLAGSFVLAVRVPTFQDFTSGNTVYLQFANNGSGDGLLLSMINRTNGAYKAYFSGYSVKSNSICLRLVVEGSKVSILVDEQDVLYNSYYNGSTNWAAGATNYDKTVTQSGGDFVMGVMNDTTTDKATAVIKRFAFYNGATAQENVNHNYPNGGAPSNALALAEAKMKFLGGFYVPYRVNIELTKQYAGKTNFIVGDTVSLNVADYFRANIISNYISGTIAYEDWSVKDLTYKGAYADGVWTYTFTKADEGKTRVFALQVNHSKATAPMVLMIRLNVVCADNDFDHACDTCGKAIGEHKAVDGTHNCGHCGRPVTECVDVDKNHVCDICNTKLSEHQGNGTHSCQYCNKYLGGCVDENGDNLCDVCGEATGESTDDNICELCGHEKGSNPLCLNHGSIEQTNSNQTVSNPTDENATGENATGESSDTKSGCKSTISGFALTGIALAICTVAKVRKKDEE